LLHSYCTSVLREVYFDAVKIQIFQVSKDLRRLSYFVPKEDNIFEYGISESYENIPCDFPPNAERIKTYGKKLENKNTLLLGDALNNIFYIPCTQEIAFLSTFTAQDVKEQDNYCNSINFDYDVEMNNPEAQIKSILKPPTLGVPAKYKIEDFERKFFLTSLRDNNFQESYNFNSRAFFMLNILTTIRNIFQIEVFTQTLNVSVIDALQLEESINGGINFWRVHKLLEFNQIDAKTKAEQVRVVHS
jgi:hypothetical protein